MPEDKVEFVERLNDALIECGNGYYDWLEDTPMYYDEDGDYVAFEGRGGKVNVMGDSLTAMMKAIAEELF